jgi:antitoxin PrlF
MAATLEVESTLTDRYQTTVPETVRRALKLGKRDKIHYTIRPSGEVVLTRVEASEGDDPVLGQFLGFLAADITRHPERLQAVDAGLVQRHPVAGRWRRCRSRCRPVGQTMNERGQARTPWSFTAGRSLPIRCSSHRLKRWRGRSRP